MKQVTRALYFFTLLLTASFASAQPFIVKIPDQTIEEDSATDLLPIRFSIPNLNLPRLTAQKASSDTNIVPLTGIVFGGIGTNRTVRVTPKQNANGVATI